MELKCRLTHSFAEIKIDEIETTIFKTDTKEIDSMIENLLSIIDDLERLKEQ